MIPKNDTKKMIPKNDTKIFAIRAKPVVSGIIWLWYHPGGIKKNPGFLNKSFLLTKPASNLKIFYFPTILKSMFLYVCVCVCVSVFKNTQQKTI